MPEKRITNLEHRHPASSGAGTLDLAVVALAKRPGGDNSCELGSRPRLLRPLRLVITVAIMAQPEWQGFDAPDPDPCAAQERLVGRTTA